MLDNTACTATILTEASSTVTAASLLHRGVHYRRNQFDTLLGLCGDIIQQASSLCQGEPDTVNEVNTTVRSIQRACEGVKEVVSVASEKGSLWCHANASWLNGRLEECKNELDNLFSTIFDIMQKERARRIVRSKEADLRDLSRIQALAAPQTSDRLMREVQDYEGSNKTSEHILDVLRKHVEDHRVQDDSCPEDIFLHKVAETLCPPSGVMDSIQRVKLVDVTFAEEDIIGHGASGQVYKGKWNGTVVAIKRMYPVDARAISGDNKLGFYHEIRTWASLRHPHLLNFDGACLEAEVPFVVMKYCPLGTIRKYLGENPDSDRARFSYEIAVGLAFLHSQDIVHADIKGANVLVSREDDAVHALLTDFGLALKLRQFRSLYTQKLDKQRGTLVYMAPEVLRGASPSKASDIYSLGLTIWEIFSEDIPYAKFLSEEILISRVGSGEHRESRPSNMPTYIWNTVEKCWMVSPEARPSAQDVQDALDPSQYSAPSQGSFDYVNVFGLASDSPAFSNSTQRSGLLPTDESRTGAPQPTQQEAAANESRRGRSRLLNVPPSGDETPASNGIASSLSLKSNTTTSRVPNDTLAPTSDIRVASRLALRASRSREPSTETRPAKASRASEAGLAAPQIQRAVTDQPRSQEAAANGGASHQHALSLPSSRDSGLVRRSRSQQPMSSDESAKGQENSVQVANDVHFNHGDPPDSGPRTRFVPDLRIPPFMSDGYTQSEPPNGSPALIDQVVREQRPVNNGPAPNLPMRPISPSDVMSPFEPFSPVSWPVQAPETNNSIAANNASRASDETSKMPKPKLSWNLDKFLEVTQYQQTFGSIELDRLLEIHKEPSPDSQHFMWPQSPNTLSMSQSVRLALYQHVIYCDDSTPMADAHRFDIVQTFIMRTADVTSRALGTWRDVQVRFINSDKAVSGRGQQLQTQIASVRPSGANNLGSSLREKVLTPLVYDILQGSGRLERPLLVSVVIDHAPQPEPRTTFRDTVRECKEHLRTAGYPVTSVLFVVAVVSDAPLTKEFVNELRQDLDVGDVVHCPTDRLEDIFAKRGTGSHEGKAEVWLLNALARPIEKLEEA
ncbi:hypothetical protein NM688_g7560 [Phlebia brevispora]|uniref:Uncharacterized protein n=1 Tax=Phlebia brevispora TaxID=194682 RepID=A0ACC1S402_9APHY|nr:hypothetical protein NM688_g7560 [Phlebia brevispora]